MAALTAAERLQLLQRSWTTVAAAYSQHFVPRFMPWTRQALQLFADAKPPARGTIAVPACGPGALLAPCGFAIVRCSCGLELCSPSSRCLHLPLHPRRLPRCAAGQELPLLAAAFPQHRIVGIDLSEGMVGLARQLVEREGLASRVEVR